MRTPVLILTVVMTTLLTGHACPEDKANPAPKESSGKVKALQKERIAVLKELADQLAVRYRNAQVPFDEVLEAQLLLLKAELDAAGKESERVALYQKTVNALKEYEELAAARVQSARGTTATVLKIKARRLEVEIQLEQAKAKDGK